MYYKWVNFVEHYTEANLIRTSGMQCHVEGCRSGLGVGSLHVCSSLDQGLYQTHIAQPVFSKVALNTLIHLKGYN